MVYLDNAQALIRWDEADKIAFIEWRSYADGEDYRRCLNILLDVLQKNKGTRILADTRLMKVVTQEDQTWVTQDWTPRALQGGVKRTALLVPKSALAKLSLARMVTTTAPDLGTSKTEYFDNVEAARSWLCS